jgi:hypothetical protein
MNFGLFGFMLFLILGWEPDFCFVFGGNAMVGCFSFFILGIGIIGWKSLFFIDDFAGGKRFGG